MFQVRRGFPFPGLFLPIWPCSWFRSFLPEDAIVLCLQVKLLNLFYNLIEIREAIFFGSQHQPEQSFSEFPCQLLNFFSPTGPILCYVEGPQQGFLFQWLDPFLQNPHAQPVQGSEDLPDFPVELVLQIHLGPIYIFIVTCCPWMLKSFSSWTHGFWWNGRVFPFLNLFDQSYRLADQFLGCLSHYHYDFPSLKAI